MQAKQRSMRREVQTFSDLTGGNNLLRQKAEEKLSLGFMERITKEEAALMQLCDAIEFYYKGRHISAITLAGAAEDILGRSATEKYNNQLQLQGAQRVRQDYAEMTADIVASFSYEQLTSITDKSPEQLEQDKKRLLKDWNQTRNDVKHNKEAEKEITVEDSFKCRAEYHIGNAIVNYKLYRNELPNEIIVQKYCRDIGIS